MSYPERGASYKNTPKWVGVMKRAEGGSADGPPIAIRLNANDPDFAMKAPLGKAGLVPPEGQQVFGNGTYGPLNINPVPISGSSELATPTTSRGEIYRKGGRIRKK